ncbi:Cj0814 family flagellar-dependent secreted protein [Campylobacter jejuni]|uniref:Cj0814 family flagellar-dependent secreted protein n=1 Tax=Campylobacter jejuni TaxID=197 RepID=UPI003DA988CB
MNITHLRDFSNSSITNIYQTSEQMKEAESLYIQSGSLIDGINGHSFGLSLEEIKNVSKGEDWQFNPDMSVYPQNEDGSYSKEALFMSFLKSYGSGQPVESPKTTLNPKVEAYNRAMAKESFDESLTSLDDIMTGKVDFASLLKSYAQDGWLDADIYEKSYGSGQPVESPKTTLNPKVEAYNRAMAKESFDESLTSLDDIMTGKVDFASLLKSYAQDGWLDADIYVMDKGVKWQNTSIGYGGAWFDNQFNQAKANGWKASSESINSFADSIADRLNNLIGQTRV